jgi:hypothetical protein
MRFLLLSSGLLLFTTPLACGSGTSARGGSDASDERDAGPPHDSGRDVTAHDARPDVERTDAGSDAAEASDAPPTDAPGDSPTSLACPSTPPEPYSPCSEALLYCSWGDDPRFQCRQRAECNSYVLPDGGIPSSLVWRSGDDDVPAMDCTTPPPSCPASAPDGADAGPLHNPPCDETQAGLTCEYSGVAYTCAPCPGPTLCLGSPDGGIPYQWFESGMAEGCPSDRRPLRSPIGDHRAATPASSAATTSARRPSPAPRPGPKG